MELSQRHDNFEIEGNSILSNGLYISISSPPNRGISQSMAAHVGWWMKFPHDLCDASGFTHSSELYSAFSLSFHSQHLQPQTCPSNINSQCNLYKGNWWEDICNETPMNSIQTSRPRNTMKKRNSIDRRPKTKSRTSTSGQCLSKLPQALFIDRQPLPYNA
jgi:hypothetical protein